MTLFFFEPFLKVPGFLKDEFPNVHLREFIGLRAKMYSILTSLNEKKATCKGIQSYIKDEVLKHEDYKPVSYTHLTLPTILRV